MKAFSQKFHSYLIVNGDVGGKQAKNGCPTPYRDISAL